MECTRVGVVDDDVQPLPALDGVLDHAAHTISSADIDVQRLGCAAGSADRLDVLARRVILDVGDQDACAVFGQAARGRAADAHCAARDDSNPTFETWQGWYPFRA